MKVKFFLRSSGVEYSCNEVEVFYEDHYFYKHAEIYFQVMKGDVLRPVVVGSEDGTMKIPRDIRDEFEVHFLPQ